MESLHPHFTAGTLCSITTCAPSRLHEQGKQALWRPEVAREQSTVWIDRGYQSDAPKVVPFGNHLRAHQHIHFAAVHTGQLSF